ncbi:MAG: FtsK/SpoIIIE domain-containing protein [Angustibacter sp.]
MKLRCTVEGDGPTFVDLVIEAAPGARWGQVAQQVVVASGHPLGTVFTAGISADRGYLGSACLPGAVPLPDAVPLGHPPLVHGALLRANTLGTSPMAAPSAAPEGQLELHVVAGPDCGHVRALEPRGYTVGRGDGADIRLEDPSLSRRHLHLEVRPDGVRVQDLGSTNGTRMGSRVIRPGLIPWPLDERIVCGNSVLELRRCITTPLSVRCPGDGTVRISRAAVEARDPADIELQAPTPPTPHPASRPAWVTWSAVLLMPLITLAGVLTLHRSPYLILALLTSLLTFGGVLGERQRDRRRWAEDRARHQHEQERHRRQLTAALTAEVSARRAVAGDPAASWSALARRSAGLWRRTADDPNLLSVRLGTGPVTSQVRERTEDGIRRPVLQNAPIVLRLDEVGHLGITGPTELVRAMARQLLVDLCIATGPSALAVITPDTHPAWAWSRWLPHKIVRETAPPAAEHQRRTVVVLDVLDKPASAVIVPSSGQTLDDTLLHGTKTRGLAPHELDIDGLDTDSLNIEALAQRAIHLLVLSPAPADLPAQCRAVVDIAAHAGALARLPDHHRLSLRPDGVGLHWAHGAARMLAPLREDGSHAGSEAIPAQVALADLLGLPDSISESEAVRLVASRWCSNGRSTVMMLGANGTGPVSVDLMSDGPHALVAGTTGAGKSELLRTMVLSLAVANRPDELGFVLIDYKGGTAFANCERVPHVTGVISDLDEQLAARALRSLRAELSRRERLLAAGRAEDLGAYQRWADADPRRPRLGRLVVVIDEFRALATELPDFMEGVVRLAAVGRALGIHLVLATQRPAGVVSADIRANVNLRIALRVRDRAESDDVLDAPDAAELPVRHPGRALIRSGGDPLRMLQVARADARSAPAPPPCPTVRPLVEETDAPATTSASTGALDRLVSTVRAATATLALPAPARPWLPPLPHVLPDAALRRRPRQLPGQELGEHQGDERPHAVKLGLLDDPDQAQQTPYTWLPEHDGHLAIIGGPRSGRSTALHRVVTELAAQRDPSTMHLHLIDFSGGRLPEWVQLPHVGTTVGRDCPRLAARLITRLVEQRRHAKPDTSEASAADRPRPTTVLLIDGWEALTEALDGIDRGRPLDELVGLLRDAGPAGPWGVLCGGPRVVSGRVAQVVQQRVVLRCTDPTDLLLAGLPPGVRPPSQQPPGRALVSPLGQEVQLALPRPPTPVASPTTTANPGGPGPVATPPVRAPLLLRALPTVVTAGDLPKAEGLEAFLGIGGDDARPLSIDLQTHTVFAVLGPPGSGRSSTLQHLMSVFHQQGIRGCLISLDPARPGEQQWPAEHPSQLGSLRADIDVLVVDDVDALLSTPAHDALVAMLTPEVPATSRPAAGAPALVVSGTPARLSGSYCGLAQLVRERRTGVVLGATSAADGDALATQALVPDHHCPGRGTLAIRGRTTPIQVAHYTSSGHDVPADGIMSSSPGQGNHRLHRQHHPEDEERSSGAPADCSFG